MSRTCGGCTLCCKVLPVPDLNKDAGTRCKHSVMGKGCGIYETRPRSCRSYHCLWLENEAALPDRFRPDRCGFVIDGIESANVLIVNVDAKKVDNWNTLELMGELINHFRLHYSIAVFLGTDPDPRVLPREGVTIDEVKRAMVASATRSIKLLNQAIAAGERPPLPAAAQAVLDVDLKAGKAYLEQ